MHFSVIAVKCEIKIFSETSYNASAEKCKKEMLARYKGIAPWMTAE